MLLENYIKLCRVCDHLLTSADSDETIKQLPWLHVLHPHPTVVEKYSGIWPDGSCSRNISITMSIARFLRNLIWGRSQNILRNSEVKLEKTDILIVSHLINADHVNKSEDFYFGNIASDLEKLGLNVTFLLFDHTGLRKRIEQSSPGALSPSKILLPERLSLFTEFGFFLKLITKALKLLKLSRTFEDQAQKRIVKLAGKSALSFESISTLRFSHFLAKLVSQLQPSVLLVPFEGHAYERAAFHIGRQVNSEINCFAYQHAILFPHQHAATRPLGSSYDPDIIFTAGSKTIDTLAAGFHQSSTEILTLGTHRASAQNSVDVNEGVSSQNVCIVLPDGNMSECLQLCKFALNCAKEIGDVTFLIRLHPLVSYSKLIEIDNQFSSRPDNLVFSQNVSLQDDAAIAKWALYRGSGSIIYAAAAGCRPIYVSLGDTIDIDPLFSLKKGKRTVSDAHALEFVLVKDRHKSKSEVMGEIGNVITFCEDYFSALEPNVLVDKIIN